MMNTSMKMNGKQRAMAAILALVAMVVLAGCAQGSTESTSDSITDIVWEWTTLKEQGQTTLEVSNPEDYTIIFREDGTFMGKSDCSGVGGTYSTEGGGYKLEMGPSTMIFCGEESLDQQYNELLSQVVAGGPDGAGGFALETAGGAERMEYRNGGPAPTQ